MLKNKILSSAFSADYKNHTGVSLLLHGDGVHGSQNFVDSSPINHVIIVPPLSAAMIATDEKKYGSGSMLFNNSDGVFIQSNPALDLGEDDFTIESFVMPTSSGSQYGLFLLGNYDYKPLTTDDTLWELAVNHDNGGIGVGFFIRNKFGGLTLLNFGQKLSVGTWYHIAVTRNFNNFKLFLDGVLVSASNADIILSEKDIYIGGGNGGYVTNLRLDELRIIKGTSIYNTDFTPPTAPFPNP